MSESQKEPFDAVASYNKELAKNKILTKDEEQRALSLAKSGDKEALASLIESYAPKAEEIALFRFDGSIPPMRLIQEANRALYYASAHLHLVPKGSSFSSFATTIVNSRLDAFIKGEEEEMKEAIDEAKSSEGEIIASPGKADSTNSVALFFQEIAKYPLLSKEEELALGRTIQKGKEEGASEEEKKAAREAVQKMVDSNLRLVANIAKNYLNKGVPFLDLIQEGSIGLQKAAEKYDPSLGNRFSTYATYWISDSLQKALAEQGRMIKIPNHMLARIAKVRKEAAKLASSLGREPTLEELSEAIPEYEEEDIASIMAIPSLVTSLDTPLNADEDDSADLLSLQKGEDDIEEGLEQEEEKRLVEKGLSLLSDRERTIICYLYGLEGKEECDMAELGRRFNISRERVRQIKESALSKMKRALGDKSK